VCGFVGVVAARGRQAPGRAAIERATAALSHRGPDGTSHLFTEIVGFGHTRLKIIDLEHGDQPIWNEDGSIVTIYNGEIWNHAALRAELERAGHVFRSRCDTEVLVHGYEEWGEGLLDRLSGMYAFAIWDTTHERLLLARDRVGKKPLYFSHTSDGLVFASDMRAVLLAAEMEPTLDRERIPPYLFQRYVNAPDTLLRGISKLPPAHMLRYDRREIEWCSYWSLALAEPVEIDGSELRGLLQEAVSDRLMSDVPLGVFLSGGLDSTLVAAMMHRTGTRRFSSFTVGFEDSRFDERPLARLTADAFGTDHHEFLVTPASFVETLPRLSWYRDEPIAEPSEVPLLLLAERASEHVKVVLTGDGGDEIFGGYPKYRADRLLRVGGRPAALALRAAGALAARRPSHRQLLRAIETVSLSSLPLRWASWFRSFSPPEIDRLLVRDLATTPAALTQPLERLLAPYEDLDPERRMLLGDFLTYLPDNMLTRADKVLMAASLEGRMPLLDYRVIQRVSNVSGRKRVGVRHGKRVLREAVKGLVPVQILRQPKRGFPVPVAEVLAADPRLVRLILSQRTIDRGIFERSELEALVAGRDSYRVARPLKLFTAAALELWLRVNVDVVRARPPETIEELLTEV
jgi:asparagine synthase (glutamine-hydrolysing)